MGNHRVGMDIKGQPQKLLPAVIRSPENGNAAAVSNCLRKNASKARRAFVREADKHLLLPAQKQTQSFRQEIAGCRQCLRRCLLFQQCIVLCAHAVPPFRFLSLLYEIVLKLQAKRKDPGIRCLIPDYRSGIPAFSQASVVSLSQMLD